VASPDATRPFALTRADEALLDDVERRSFRYFWEQGETPTGQVRDRARADGGPHPQAGIGSIAATGFGLTALCVGADRGWAPPDAIAGRVRTTLRFLASGMPHERGWFYHFVNTATGAREWKCELSSIDTALLLAGVLTARQRFNSDPAVVRDGRYVAPAAPGYSIEMLPESLDEYAFPDGPAWVDVPVTVGED